MSGRSRGGRKTINSTSAGIIDSEEYSKSTQDNANKKKSRKTTVSDAKDERGMPNFWEEGGRLLRSRTEKDNLRSLLPINELSFDIKNATPKLNRGKGKGTNGCTNSEDQGTASSQKKRGTKLSFGKSETASATTVTSSSPPAPTSLKTLASPNMKNADASSSSTMMTPTSHTPQTPIQFGYRYPKTDVVMEMFGRVGDYCSFCSKKVQSQDVICCDRCKDLMCTDCFLMKHHCSNRHLSPESDVQTGDDAARVPHVNEYHLSESTFQTFSTDDDEKVLNLEIQFMNLN